MKKYWLLFLITASVASKAQKIDSIYVNLYTDSLKKGTYNYINIDGLQSNGRYLPLDSTHIIFSASAGKFYGNTLWIDKNITEEKITIKAVLRKNPVISKEFTIWIKKKENDEKLKTAEELLNEMENENKAKKNKKG